ncbi:FCD domain-containing protein [uncultured Corynebacterium sp.]|uniref:FadR/GntR family transcriptional regulator n=1 Tax=uncultured Corynebacterium sp. TaxID=159447 RepID=UPI002889DC15|nr:FCD domain-containing protein [uncultured Corynebacterium sp.]
MPRSTPSPTTPLLEKVLDALGGEIVSGLFEEGDVFTLQEISDRFDISRTVAREVMRALELMGLVASSRRVGLKVQPPSNWSVLNPHIIEWRLRSEATRDAQMRSLFQLRAAIEPAAARYAARNASEDHRLHLGELAEELLTLGQEGRGDSPAFLAADLEFHSLILKASGNEMFAALAPSLGAVMSGRTALGLQPAAPNEAALRDHLELAQAIVTGDAATAEARCRSIVAEADHALR